jgi:hypothetical protein
MQVTEIGPYMLLLCHTGATVLFNFLNGTGLRKQRLRARGVTQMQNVTILNPE